MIISRKGSSPDFRRRAITAARLGLLSFGLAIASIALTNSVRGISSIWLANAVLLAALLGDEDALCPDVLLAGLLANIAANLLMRGEMAVTVVYSAVNMVEVAIAAFGLRRSLGSASTISEAGALGPFILWAGIVAPVVSALGGAATAHVVYGHSFARSFQTWFVSDALGLLIFTPFWLSLFNGEYSRGFRAKTSAQRAEAAGLLLATTAVAGAVFCQPMPLLFTLFPPVMLISFRFGRLGAQAAILVIAVIGSLATLRHYGPLTLMGADATEQAQYFQFFLAVLLLSCLPMAADLSARAAVVQDLSERELRLRSEKAELTQRAMTDPLTGLLNRAGFWTKAEVALAQVEKYSAWLIAIDVDGLKHVNDQHGHQAGDMALTYLASIIRAVMRQSDIAGRIGDDEFFVLIYAASETQVRGFCDRLLTGVSETSDCLGVGNRPLSVSCGAARATRAMSLDELARHAEGALSKAKGEGQGRAVVAQEASA